MHGREKKKRVGREGREGENDIWYRGREGGGDRERNRGSMKVH